MASTATENQHTTTGPTSLTARSPSVPKKHGRFLIIEPPPQEEEDELLESPPASIDSVQAQPGNPNTPSQKTADEAVGSSSLQSTVANTAPPQILMTTPTPTTTSIPTNSEKERFMVKNTDGPLFDPSMAESFGWTEDSTPTSPKSTPSSSSSSISTKLLPPMSPDDGLLTRNQREFIRKEWLDNILKQEAKKEKLAAEKERLRLEKHHEHQHDQLSLPASTNLGPDKLASSSSSETKRHSAHSNNSNSSDNEYQKAITVLDLTSYTARRLTRQDSTPAELEAKLQNRRDSGPPPPRPSDSSSDSNISSVPSAQLGSSEPLPVTLTSSSPPPFISSSQDSAILNASKSNPDLESSRSPSSDDAKDHDDAVLSPKSRGRSVSVSKKIGGFFGKIFDGKSRPEGKSKTFRPKARSSIALSASSEISSSSKSPPTSPRQLSPRLVTITQPLMEEVSETHSTTTTSEDSSPISVEDGQSSRFQMAMIPSTSDSSLVNTAEVESSPQREISSPTSTPTKSNRPKPPIPPKPSSLRGQAKTFRPSTNTKAEFGLSET